MIFIGIDPGKSGALAAIDENMKIRLMYDYEYDPQKALRFLTECSEKNDCHAVIENVQAMSLQSNQTEFVKQAGILEGLLIASKIPYSRVTPARWKHIMIPRDIKAPPHSSASRKKDESRLAALRVWPGEATDRLKRKKDHDRADALLMALYCLRKWRGELK